MIKWTIEWTIGVNPRGETDEKDWVFALSTTRICTTSRFSRTSRFVVYIEYDMLVPCWNVHECGLQRRCKRDTLEATRLKEGVNYV